MLLRFICCFCLLYCFHVIILDIKFINVVMNMYKVSIGYMGIKVSECYECVHGVVCSSFFSILHPQLNWPPSQTVASPIVSTEASSEQEEAEHQPLTTPRHSKPLVSTEASSGAMICPESKREESIVKDNDKNVCPRGICIMKRPNSHTWWVSCSKCGQWYHIRCVKLTKKVAQNNSFNCKNLDT